jgi:ABC-type transport system involved in multi-copper enzyme maturation permease subunit/TolA-binding protein
MNSRALLRYNFRVLMANNWWLLVFPLVVSQLTVFWNLITQKFSPALPVTSAELITPLLAAFLTAHLLSAEYTSRIGAILATKPMHIGKVIVARYMAVLLLVGALGLLSLAAYYVGMQPYDVGQAIIAAIPSTLFLSLLALTFSTLFRHPLAGFAIAMIYWAMDLAPGPPMNAYLSLRTLSYSLSVPENFANDFTRQWWIAKILLLVGAFLLYKIHARLVFKLGTPLTHRKRRQAVGAAAAICVVYIITGASAKAWFGYRNRGLLVPSDTAWFRQQFASFGPIPASSLFGPAFNRYVGQIPNGWRPNPDGESDLLGNDEQHRVGLRMVVDKMQGSVWAPSAAELLARLDAPRQNAPEKATAFFQTIIDRYPNSPYFPFALREKARLLSDGQREEAARAAYEDLVKRAPGNKYSAEGYRYLTEYEIRHGNMKGAVSWGEQWVKDAPLQERFTAYLALATARKGQGDAAGAATAAKQAIAAVKEFKRALTANNIVGTNGEKVKWDRMSNEAESKAKAFE